MKTNLKLNTLKSLEQVIDLCRRKGVQSISIGDIKLELGAAKPKKPNFDDGKPPKIKELSEDEVLFYSSGALNG